MIDPKELRIGNLLLFRGGYMKVSGIDPHSQGVYLEGDDGKFSLESPKGMPLTPEWLERMGFVNDPIGSLAYKGAFRLYEYNEDGIYVFSYNNGSAKLQYVHQLQNLHFALTGEEIKIKELV